MPYSILLQKLEQKLTQAAKACYGSYACTIHLCDGRQLNIICNYYSDEHTLVQVILYDPQALSDQATVDLKKNAIPDRHDKKVLCRGIREAMRRCEEEIRKSRTAPISSRRPSTFTAHI